MEGGRVRLVYWKKCPEGAERASERACGLTAGAYKTAHCLSRPPSFSASPSSSPPQKRQTAVTAPNSHYLRRAAGAESAIGKREEQGGPRRWKIASEARKQHSIQHNTSLVKLSFPSYATLYENDLPSLCRSPVRERGEKGAIRRSKGNRPHGHGRAGDR